MTKMCPVCLHDVYATGDDLRIPKHEYLAGVGESQMLYKRCPASGLRLEDARKLGPAIRVALAK